MKQQCTEAGCKLKTAAAARADNLNLEDYSMHRAKYLIGSFLLVAALAAPVSIRAIPATQEDHKQDEHKKVYDKQHKDYHNWDDNENRAWGNFLTENHRDSHDFAKANKKEQSEYWNWRHSHPDKD